MSESFGKSLNLFIFHFLIICSNTFAYWTCVSEEGVPPEMFKRHHYENIAFIKNVAIDLGRHLHAAFGLTESLDICNTLVGFQTRYGEEELTFNNPAAQQTLQAVYATTYEMLALFHTDPDFLNFPLSAEDRRNIFDWANTAIYRLRRSGKFESTSELIVLLRILKNDYSDEYRRNALVIEGVAMEEVPLNSELLFGFFTTLIQPIGNFRSREVRNLDGTNLLYVSQGEMAITRTDDDNVVIVGSGGATTSIIVVINMAGTGIFGIAHVDKNENTQEGLTELVNKMITMAGGHFGRLEMSLIGGMTDSNGLGDDIFFNIMDAIHKQDYPVHLMFACVGIYNTNIKNTRRGTVRKPILTSVAIDLKDGVNQLVPATFTDTGPDMELRAIRLLYVRNSLLDIYDYYEEHFVLTAFDYQLNFDIDWMLEQPDAYLKTYFRSPFGFDPNAAKLRRAVGYLRNYPRSGVAFPNGNDRIYVRNHEDGSWIPQVHH